MMISGMAIIVTAITRMAITRIAITRIAITGMATCINTTLVDCIYAPAFVQLADRAIITRLLGNLPAIAP
jgi:hypothetical protein